MIFIENRKKSLINLKKLYPNALFFDLTSKSSSEFLVFSPFYPHGNIPVPFSCDSYSFSVEGIWQGLKVFERADIDTSKFLIQNMKGIKRSIRQFGKVLGHRDGVDGSKLLDYKSARMEIYLKCYNWVIETKLQKDIERLAKNAQKKDLVFLDYETNADINDFSRPLSHAGLVKLRIEKIVKVFDSPMQGRLNF